MILFKDCPRCKGDLSLLEDKESYYWECIQCGYCRDVEVKTLSISKLTRSGKSYPVRVHGEPYSLQLFLKGR